MKKMMLNGWYIDDNQLGISLPNLYVSIDILQNGEFVYYQTTIKGDEELVLNFYSIEDAVFFVENDIVKCRSTKEVLEIYNAKFKRSEFVVPDKVESEEIKLELTPEEVKQLIQDYYSKIKPWDVSVKYELLFQSGKLDLKFYIVEHLDSGDIVNPLTVEGLRSALTYYADSFKYDLIDFKFIGGVHRAGYYYDEDTPHYDGIQLKVRNKNNGKLLSRKQNN